MNNIVHGIINKKIMAYKSEDNDNDNTQIDYDYTEDIYGTNVHDELTEIQAKPSLSEMNKKADDEFLLEMIKTSKIASNKIKINNRINENNNLINNENLRRKLKLDFNSPIFSYNSYDNVQKNIVFKNDVDNDIDLNDVFDILSESGCSWKNLPTRPRNEFSNNLGEMLYNTNNINYISVKDIENNRKYNIKKMDIHAKENILYEYIKKNEKFFYFLDIRIQLLLNLEIFQSENRMMTLQLREGLLSCTEDVRTVSTDLNFITHYINDFNVFELLNFDENLVSEIERAMTEMKFLGDNVYSN